MYQLRMLLVILFTGTLVMILITPYDLQLSIWLTEHQLARFGELMSESMFELEKPGGGDLIVLFVTLSLLLYCGSSLLDINCRKGKVLHRLQGWLRKKQKTAEFLRSKRLQLEFLVVSSFCCSTLMVKTLKWIMARPRPKKFFWGTRPFFEWYEVGPYFLDEGTYRAGFPSGHTASAITLIGLAYVLIYTGPSERSRTWGRVLMIVSLWFAFAMATARVMTVAHWPTDVIFSIFAGWLLIHILFFYGFGLPATENRAPPPPFRGIRICWYLALSCLSLVAIVLGLRHFAYDRWPWLILVCLPALPLLIYSVLKTGREGLFATRSL